MTKTQIQVPEELFRELRSFAKQREWSLAETFRRGAELLLQVYPEAPELQSTAWTPPTSGKVGWKGLSAAQLRDAAFDDGDPRLA
ncbi:antitoxin [Prosthecobacter sp.]|uniref:antitoxin n=1 Tax=Prosthecobacter sp. TaxID=1965333 RepID=UPI003784946B